MPKEKSILMFLSGIPQSLSFPINSGRKISEPVALVISDTIRRIFSFEEKRSLNGSEYIGNDKEALIFFLISSGGAGSEARRISFRFRFEVGSFNFSLP